MSTDDQWDAFERWLEATYPRRPFKHWIPLFRDGEMVAHFLGLTVRSDDSVVLSCKADHVVQSEECKIGAISSFVDAKRKTTRAAAKAAMAKLHCFPSKAKALAHAKQNPDTSVLYDPKEHNFGQLLIAIVVYQQQTDAARRPRSEPAPDTPVTEQDLAEARRRIACMLGERQTARGPEPARAPAPEQPLARKLSPAELWTPPTADVQIMRYAALNTSLAKFLKERGVYNVAGKPHWACIREWVATDQGHAALRSAALDPLSVHLDHVVPDNLGGVSCLFNCVFMPGSANSHFGCFFTPEKHAFVGKAVVAHACAFARWHTSHASARLGNYSHTGVYVAP